MAQQYRQLSLEEREQMQIALWQGKSLRKIAHELRRSSSTISRELKRNGSWGNRRYHPRLAHERTKTRTRKRGQRMRLKHPVIQEYAHEKLQEGWSPEQIAGRIQIDHPRYRISHEAIYQYIYAQYRRGGYGVCTGTDLRRFLRRRHKIRHPKKVLYAVEKGAVPNRTFIDNRPAEVYEREIPGHWEGDTIESRAKLPGLNTLVERLSGLVFISKLEHRTSVATATVIIRRLKRIPRRLRRTLTLDNGSENAKHETITDTLGTKCYFAHAYHFWERGTNENTNGLIRWYLPKGTDLSAVPENVINSIEYCLNTRPRKRLKWHTPLEVFNSYMLH